MPNNIEIQEIVKLAKQAGKIIMKHYQQSEIETSYKHDSSPVSAADLESNELICHRLEQLYPHIPIISEENKNDSQIEENMIWMIDPLDGTKSFLNKTGEFTVNIGLIIDNKPKLGVVYSPLSDMVYYVGNDGIPYKEPTPIQVRIIPKEGATILTSALSTNYPKLTQYLQSQKVNKIIPTSSAFKICMIAEGVADLYPRFGQTMEWDTAAGHAILNAAGGSITDLDNKPLTYGHFDKQYYNPEFIAKGKNSSSI